MNNTMTNALQLSKNVLFVHYGDNWIRGSERCLIDLLKHINKELFNPVLWCNSDVLAQEVRKLGIDVYVDDFPLLFGERHPRFDFKGYRDLIREGQRIVDTHNIELIHSNSGAPSQWMNWVARSRKLPLVLHLHARYPLRDRITLGLHHASMAVGVSQPVVDQLLSDGANDNRCKVIPNGIDTDTLLSQPVEDIRKTLQLPSDAFIAMSVCSLIHRKGVDLLIDACRKLRAMRLPIHFVVIGEGEERAALEEQIAHHNLQSHVHLIGERDNVVGLMRGSADICVSAAREEVFGLTLAEAGLARLPVVAPLVGGIPSVIENNVTGKLIQPEDAHAIAQAIYHLYTNQDQRVAMGRAGYQRVMTHFTIEAHTAEFESLYQSLTSDPSMNARWLTQWQVIPPMKASFKFVQRYRGTGAQEVAL
ncbi:glycosyltransferase family 4 protein [Enterovibrio sp. ZSDZ35]|uniref:Glycosyltransferase family 4 protein n=1 Tax=Enterovibrio qingdaonensis TaxID=2899818 RepID=A0ABT5QTV7_9GAMM|nr:glycosyltransferase family 4 protein [Enterovibrio sp. ZSDZ35]MDD1783945.1 glycosyltransferase family 4 protein [Enterovibrio sp. ZSDZ35]